MFSTKFGFLWICGFRGEDFVEIDQPETRIAYGAMFVNGSERNEQYIYRGPLIDASYQVSVHLAKRFQRRRFF